MIHFHVMFVTREPAVAAEQLPVFRTTYVSHSPSLEVIRPALSRQSHYLFNSTEFGPHWQFVSEPLFRRLSLASTCGFSAFTYWWWGRNRTSKTAKTKVMVFTRASPYLPQLSNEFYISVCLRLWLRIPPFWPRWDRLYPIPAKKSPNLGLSSFKLGNWVGTFGFWTW